LDKDIYLRIHLITNYNYSKDIGGETMREKLAREELMEDCQ